MNPQLRWALLILGTVSGILLCMIFSPPSCEKLTENDFTENVKSLKQEKQEIKPVIEYRDREVIKWRTAYRHLKDTIEIPSVCDTVVKVIFTVCDSVIEKDSLLIESLENQARIDSSITANQDKLIEMKGDTIKVLKRKLKRSRLITKILVVVAAGSLGYGLAK